MRIQYHQAVKITLHVFTARNILYFLAFVFVVEMQDIRSAWSAHAHGTLYVSGKDTSQVP
jgi:hypothetical protein